MLAAIDAGSNTLRLLVGEVNDGRVVPRSYLRRITRLAGDFSPQQGLSPLARQRTLSALQEFAAVCRQSEIAGIRAVGTAAFRQALNGVTFVAEIRAVTGLPMEIITSDQEARYMGAGVLSALEPIPAHALIVDIGGGSTEFVLCAKDRIVWARSLPLGVVRLTESHANPLQRQQAIAGLLTGLKAELLAVCATARIDPGTLVLVGTAGSVTSLAALDLQMERYDWRRINNYSLSLSRLQDWQTRLLPLAATEREALPGMEAGRGDLIMAGLEIVLWLLRHLFADRLVVSDFGLLEGLLLGLQNDVDR